MTNFVYLNLLMEIVLKNYFLNSRCVLIFTDSESKIEVQVEIPTVYMEVHNNTLNSDLIFRHYGCQDVIIHHENGSDLFIQFEKLIRLKNERFNGRKYVIIQEDVSNIFTSEELDHICNLLVIVPTNCFEKESYDLMTHLYRHKSRSREPEILDKWFSDNSSFLYGNNLFPDKLSDQNGRQLRIGTFTYEPYSIAGQDNKTMYGTEADFMSEFVKKHNFIPHYTIIGADLWGDIYDNWTGFGLFGSLVDDAVDIGYDGLFTWEKYYNFLDYTKPLSRTGVTCLVPAPQLATGWLTPLRSFSLKMWFALFLTFFFDVIVLTCLLQKSTDSRIAKIVENFDKSMTTMIRFHSLQPLTMKLSGRLITYFIALTMGYILFLSNTYSSGLATVMTIPRYQKSIKTVDDLAFSGLQWGATTDAWIFSMEKFEEENYVIIKNNFIVKEENDLEALSKKGNFGFAIERLPYGHYAIGSYIKRDVLSNYRLLEEDIYWEHCVFMVRKNSVLLPLLDNLILRVFEAGLGSYWEPKAVSQNMDMSVQRGIRYYNYYNQDHNTVKLKLTHVQGAFGILIIGYVISSIAFFGENVANSRCKKIQHETEML